MRDTHRVEVFIFQCSSLLLAEFYADNDCNIPNGKQSLLHFEFTLPRSKVLWLKIFARVAQEISICPILTYRHLLFISITTAICEVDRLFCLFLHLLLPTEVFCSEMFLSKRCMQTQKYIGFFRREWILDEKKTNKQISVIYTKIRITPREMFKNFAVNYTLDLE